MNTTFSCDTRVIACDNCGAPVQATPAAGSFQCEYCRAINELQSRQEQVAPESQAPIDEFERLRRLRSQDGSTPPPPADLLRLVPGGLLTSRNVPKAVTIWQGLRHELRSKPSSPMAAERLVFLTMLLVTNYQVKHDLLRQRAMLESALEVLELPRHKQMMRGYLCRCACRSGDLTAAEEWLAPCDPRSDDLETDTAYRYSRACIDTASGNYEGVLEILGGAPTHVPIMDSFDHVCAVLRANAWEKRGNLAAATNLLVQAMAIDAGGASGRLAVEKVVQLQHPPKPTPCRSPEQTLHRSQLRISSPHCPSGRKGNPKG